MSRAYAHDRASVFRLLQSDHRYVLTALHECKTLRTAGDTDLMHTLAHQTGADIERHMQMDTRVLYPHLCHALSADILARWNDAAHQIQHLLKGLRQWTHADDLINRAHFQTLGHVFCQHVKLEEGLIFHQLSRAKIDWLHLHGDLLQCREELAKETIVVDGAAAYF